MRSLPHRSHAALALAPAALVLLSWTAVSPAFAAADSPVIHSVFPEQPSDEDISAIFDLSEAQLGRLVNEAGLSNLELLEMGPALVAKTLRKLDAPKPDEPGQAMHWRFMQRADANGVIARGALLKAKAQRDALMANAAVVEAAPPAWEWLGPGNIGGRTRSMLINPIDPNIMYAGSVGGGVWKTIDGAASWQPLTDFLPSIAVGSMAMDPNDPNTFYVGTGEGYFNGDSIPGAGIFKTVDAGATFTQLPSTNNPDFDFVNRIDLAPGSSTVMLVATNNGIFRSTDAGQNFILVSSGRTLDVEFSRTDPSIAVAGTNTAVRWSSNGGMTWTTTSLPGGTGGAAARVEVAIAPSDPTIVYASSQFLGMFRSTNGGQSFVSISTQFYMGNQGWYDNIVWVDPTDPDTVIIGGIDLWRTRNAGLSWIRISQWQFAPQSAHADHHFIIVHPGFDGVTNKIVYFSNDGGIYKANDAYFVQGTTGWQVLNNNYGVTQFYGGAGNQAGSGTLVGGTQDNGTLVFGGFVPIWSTMFGGDGAFGAADQIQNNFLYGETQWARVHRSSDGGLSSTFIFSPSHVDAVSAATNFISPMILDPNDANILYVGSNRLWRTSTARTEDGTGWSIVHNSVNSNHSAMAVAQGDSNLLWVGHNNGDIYMTTNAANATPTWTQMDLNAPALPNRFCTRIVIDPTNHNRVWATFSGFNFDNVWLTQDGGLTWAPRVGTSPTKLPALPVNGLALDPTTPGRIYLATDLGVFLSEDDGLTWTTSNVGPANTVVDEVFTTTMSSSPFLIAATHGRGMYRLPLIIPNPADLTGDGVVSAPDLASLLSAWGTTLADINADGTTDSADLAILLGNWG